MYHSIDLLPSAFEGDSYYFRVELIAKRTRLIAKFIQIL